jgi:hypothetical protein
VGLGLASKSAEKGVDKKNLARNSLGFIVIKCRDIGVNAEDVRRRGRICEFTPN